MNSLSQTQPPKYHLMKLHIYIPVRCVAMLLVGAPHALNCRFFFFFYEAEVSINYQII